MLKFQRIENLLLFLTILFLPTQLGRHFWPPFSKVYSLPIDYLSPVIYFWDLLVIALIGVFLLQRKKVNLNACNIFLFFILTQAISLFPLFTHAINMGAGLVRLEQYFIAGLFGVYLISSKFKIPASTAKRDEQNSKLYMPLILAVILESVLGIAQFIGGGSLGLWILGERAFTIDTPGIAKFDYHGSSFLRPYATLPHPNVLAAFLFLSILILIMVYPVLKEKTSARLRWLVKIALVIGALTILLTVSRVVLLLLIILLIFKFWKKYHKQLLIIFIILLPVLFTRFSSLINYDNLSLIRREELFTNGFNYFSSSPLFGVGLNNFISYSSSELISGPSKFLQPAHNIFLLALSETGIVGFIGWAVLLGVPLYRLRFKICDLRFMTLWASVFILGLFDHYFLTLPAGYRMLFLLWGLSFLIE